jgi:glycosyltransferase involved in cell wall biosynthesis
MGGNTEAVLDGRTGYLVAPGDAGALADRICRLLQNGEQRAAMGAAARQRVTANFSARGTAQKVAQLYEELSA